MRLCSFCGQFTNEGTKAYGDQVICPWSELVSDEAGINPGILVPESTLFNIIIENLC